MQTILFCLALSSMPGGAQVNGGLFHTIRYSDGSWQPFGDVKSQAGDPGSVLDVSAAGNNSIGELHLVVSTYDGGLFHTVRNANGAWQSFGDVKGQAGNPGQVTDVSATVNSSTGELHLVVSTYGGGLFHTIRDANGAWQPFGDVNGQAGDPSFGIVGARVGTALIGGNLHVLASTQTGGLFHTIRYAYGAWQPFHDVKSQTGDPGFVFEVSAAGNNSTGELQVVAIAGGKPKHAIRSANGAWSGFGDVTGQVGDPSACGYPNVGTDLIGGSLHLAASTNKYCLQ